MIVGLLLIGTEFNDVTIKVLSAFSSTIVPLALVAVGLQLQLKLLKEEIKLYKEVLTLDVYLRENIKSRPSFSADIKELKDEIRDFYMDEKNMVYLGNYSDLSTNQVINAMHLEIFEHDIFAFISGDKIAAAKTRVLFDYKERNPVNDGARYYIV